MDVNLTYPIAANAYPIAVNVTLNQPWWILFIPLLSAVTGLIGAVIGAGAAIIASQNSEKLRFKISEHQKQKDLFAQLTGCCVG